MAGSSARRMGLMTLAASDGEPLLLEVLVLGLEELLVAAEAVDRVVELLAVRLVAAEAVLVALPDRRGLPGERGRRGGRDRDRARLRGLGGVALAAVARLRDHRG